MTRAPRSRRHIIHITAPAEFGGLERVVINLCSGLVDAGNPQTVVCVLDTPPVDHPVVAALESAGVRVIPVVVPARAYRRESQLLAQIINESRADVVHTHGYRSDVIGGWVARRAGVPVVSTLHGFTARSLTGRIFEWIQLRSLRQFDAVVGVSKTILDRVLSAGVRASRVHLIPNAWSTAQAPLDRASARRALNTPDDAFAVGWVGRLSYEKGADVFVDALARWNPTGSAIASIIGDGRERPALEARATELAISHMIQWHGARRDAGQLMQAFDVLVLSSRTEGVPMVLLEAMQAGTPVIATAVGGVPSVVDSSEAVLIPSESAEALASALERIRQTPDETRRRAENATRRLASQFAVGPWLDQYMAIYAAVARSTQASDLQAFALGSRIHSD